LRFGTITSLTTDARVLAVVVVGVAAAHGEPVVLGEGVAVGVLWAEPTSREVHWEMKMALVMSMMMVLALLASTVPSMGSQS